MRSPSVFFLSCILLHILIEPGLGANIVVFHLVASYSHRVATWPLAEALSQRGHQVTYISPFYPKHPNPNITEIVPQKMATFVADFLDSEFDINLRVKDEMQPLAGVAYELGTGACEALHDSPEFKTWLNKSRKVDLLIIDNCLPECGVALAYKLKAKYIIFSTITAIANEYDAYGYSPESSSIPELEIHPFTVPMGFLDRVSNTLMSLHWRWLNYQYTIQIDSFLRESFGTPEMPFIGDLVRNTSLIFYTGDAVTDYPRALPPLFVNVAGMHCKSTTKSLPSNLESFINSTISGSESDGFIYISLGSLVVSSNLPENIKQIFFNAIRSFPRLKFFWKWNGEFPKEIPENLFLDRWFPQQDMLGHPKVRGFVTQGGRPSTLEAIYNGCPMIAFPILGDQDHNANRVNFMEGNILFEIGKVTLPQFKEAIEKIAYDAKMKARLQRLQTILREQPMNPVKSAVWWTEYVLKHETDHLKPTGNNQYWFQRRLLDVWAFLFVMLLITLSVSVFFILICIHFLIDLIYSHQGQNRKFKQT